MKFRKYTAVLTTLLLLTIATFAWARTTVMFDDMGMFTGPAGLYSRYDDLDDLVTTLGPGGVTVTVVVTQQMDMGAAAVAVPGNITLDFKRQGAINITAAQTVTFTSAEQIIAAKDWPIFVGAGALTNLTFTSGGTVVPQWWGALPDSGIDYTDQINGATASGAGIVFMSGGTWMIDAVGAGAGAGGILLASNQKLVLSPDTILQVIPNANTNYAVIRSWSTTNVTVEGNGATLTGDRGTHVGGGEWGFGIDFRAVITGTIQGPILIQDMWGDGIYLGTAGGANNEDIVIDKVVSDNNRRQGMSITGANNTKITNSAFRNTNGTAPESGIDLEPTAPGTVTNTQIDNVSFYNNRNGLLVYDADNTTVNNVIMDHNEYSLYFLGLVTGFTISNSQILNAVHYNIYAHQGDDLTDIKVQNNLIANADDSEIYLNDNGGGVRGYWREIFVEGNTFLYQGDNTAKLTGFITANNAEYPIIFKNNTFIIPNTYTATDAGGLTGGNMVIRFTNSILDGGNTFINHSTTPLVANNLSNLILQGINTFDTYFTLFYEGNTLSESDGHFKSNYNEFTIWPAGWLPPIAGPWDPILKVPGGDPWRRGDVLFTDAPATGDRIGNVCVFSFATTLNGGEPIAETNMVVFSGAGTIDGDVIGVVQDDGTTFWSTIAAGGGTLTLTMAAGLTVAAADGNAVYVMRWEEFGQAGYRSRAGTPVANFVPYFIGERVFDTAAAEWWTSTGATNNDWKQDSN